MIRILINKNIFDCAIQLIKLSPSEALKRKIEKEAKRENVRVKVKNRILKCIRPVRKRDCASGIEIRENASRIPRLFERKRASKLMRRCEGVIKHRK